MSTSEKEDKKSAAPTKRVIRLDDLDWQDDVVGGNTTKRIFGEEAAPATPFTDLFKPTKG